MQRNSDSEHEGEMRMKKRKGILSVLLLAVFLSAAAGGSLSRAKAEDMPESGSAEDRLKYAGESGLSDYVDEEGYLTEDYLGEKSTRELEQAGTAPLIRSYKPGGDGKTASPAVKSAAGSAGRTARAGNGTVTASELVRYMNTVVGYFEVNGIQAFCAEHGVDRPLVGESTSAPENVTDTMQKKVLYYGYSGPAQWDGIFSFEQGRAVTSLALSYYYSGPDSLNWGIHGNYSTQMGLSDFIYYIEGAAAPPEGFRAYKVSTGNGAKQDLMYWEYQPNGYLSLQKQSADTGVTSGNSAYSLENAEYRVYIDGACTIPALTADSGSEAVLTTDASGRAGTVCLPVGEYYLKETKAPQGYITDPEIYRVSIAAEHTSSVPNIPVVTDTPQMLPVDILLRKVDSLTGGGAQGTGTLEGARFRVRFYGTEKESDPGKDGTAALRTWIFQTDEEGRLKYSTEYLISGDDLYYDAEKKPALPRGTLTFEEISPPPGYLLNEVVITAAVKAGDSSTLVYQEPVQKENIIRLTLIKVQAGTEKAIPGVVFEHTGPDGKKTRYTTDKNGTVEIQGLREGKHTIREISVPDGLCLNENRLTFSVDRNGVITVTSKAAVTEKSGDIKITVCEKGKLGVRVENQPAPFALKIRKENEKGTVLEGAEFTLFTDRECSRIKEKAVTGADGTLLMEELCPGTVYYLKETKAPDGYRITEDETGGVPVWEIRAESDVSEGTFTFYVNGKPYTEKDGQFCVTGTKKDRTACMTVYNQTGAQLPKTGGSGEIPVTAAGAVLTAGASVLIWRKRKGGSREI